MQSYKLSIAILTIGSLLMTAPAGADTKLWTGTNSTLASDDANWEPAGAPDATDAVLLNASSSTNLIWDLDTSVASWTQDGYEGVVTFETLFGSAGFTNFTLLILR